MMFDGLGSSAAHIKGGRIKGLAVASNKRAPGFPDLPATAELGLASYQVATWYGLWAPKGTPKDVVDRIQAELRKALNSEELVAVVARHRRGHARPVRRGLWPLRQQRGQALGRGRQVLGREAGVNG